MDSPPPNIPLGPVPSTFNIEQRTLGDGKVWNLLIITTPLGPQVHFMPPEVAKRLGENLVKVGSMGQLVFPHVNGKS